MITPGINLVMTVIGFGLSIMFIVFVCTRLICARIQLSASRRSLARANRSDLSNLERGFHGLEPLALANIPMMKYRDICLTSKESACQRCPVCLGDYQEEDTVCVLPVCGHSFHATCIGIWLQQQSTCPVCRISLRELPERKWYMQPMFSHAMRSQYRAHYCHCMANGNSRLSPLRTNNDEIQEHHFPLEGDVGHSNGEPGIVCEKNRKPGSVVSQTSKPR